MRNFLLPLVCLFSILSGCLSPEPPANVPDDCPPLSYGVNGAVVPPLHVDGAYFKDQDGRVVLLRGVNAAGDSKVPPFMPLVDTSLLDPLPGWGINVVRLLFTWEAFESNRCSYEASYLDYYEQVVSAAAARNMYVIVDFHQDGYSRYSISGCGEGFPQWAVTSAVALDTPKNDGSCEDWGTMMIVDLDHHTTWSHFHSNREGVRTRYLDMVKAVADRMASHSNVIGYDFLNEPWGEGYEIRALYQSAEPIIRERHPDAVLFASPHALVSGVSNNTMGEPSFGNFAYAPHYYDSNIFLTHEWDGTDPGIRLNTLKSTANAWAVPMFLGEFGAANSTVFGEGYMEATYQWLDQNFISATQWSYTPGWTPSLLDGWNRENFSIVDDQGQLRSKFEPRPYPQKTAGVPVAFNRTASGFTYEWTNDSLLGASEIYLPAGYAASKVLDVQTVSGPNSECSVGAQLIVCNISEDGPVTLSFSEP